MKVRLYHTTTHNRADSIMHNGFYDGTAWNSYLLGTYPNRRAVRPKLMLTCQGEIYFRYPPAAWFSDLPLINDALFDDNGYFNGDAERQSFIAIDVRLPIRGIRSSRRDKTWPGIQYWGPASIWNQFPRTRIELDDIVRLRLASDPKLRSSIRPLIMRYDRLDPDDPYGLPFHRRVKRILEVDLKQ
jgi:hypothetical protein